MKLSRLNTLGAKLAIAMAVVFSFFSLFNIYSFSSKEQEQAIRQAKSYASGIADTVLSSLNSMMVEGTIDQRGTFLDLLRKTTPGLDKIRIFRSKSVTDQYGEGLAGEQPVDDMDHKALATGKPQFEIIKGEGHRQLRAVIPLLIEEDRGGVNCMDCHEGSPGDANGAVSMLVSMEAIDQKLASDFKKISFTQFVELVLLLAILLFIIYRIVLKPTRKVVSVIQAMGKGDLDVRAGIDSGDEIGQIANAVDDFADNLKNEVMAAFDRLSEGDFTFEASGAIKEGLGKTNARLNELITELTDVSDHIADGTRELSSASHSLSQGASEQAESINRVSTTIEQMSSQIKLTADNASQADQLSKDAREAANKGNAQMDEMVEAMQKIVNSGQKISNIIKVIDEIAFQTNLLALNAAVEAARAGRHGKGFAVVAEEVRNLASRSAKAARETSELIESSVQDSQNGADIAGRTAGALDEIVSLVTKVTDLVGEIAQASGDQAQAITETNNAIASIDEVTQKNSTIAEENAAATEQLSSNASRLRDMMSRFKLASKKERGIKALPGKSHAGVLPPRRKKVKKKASRDKILIEWSDDLSVGVPEMNDQHKRLVEIINEFYAAMREGKGKDTLKNTLDSLIDYTKTHFKEEEQLQEKYGFPGLREHKNLHKELLEQVENFHKEYESGKNTVTYEIMKFLKDWLVSHIKGTDKRYGQFIHDQERRRQAEDASRVKPSDVIALDDDMEHF